MRPLDGIRVLDLADEKGELCGRLLADLGADVVRVEPPAGARSRRLPPFAPDGRTSLYFAFRNANKRGISLDVATPTGAALLERLAVHFDVLVESFAPGFLARSSAGPEKLLADNPALVVTSITDFGQTGPYRDYAGTDLVGFALGGLLHRAGAASKPPVVAPGALAYDSAGVTAAFATLVAYWKRLRTGRGQHIDVSVMESTANLSDWALPNHSQSGQIGKRDGAGIYVLYPCADGFVRMIILVAHHWKALLDWMGKPPELLDPAFEQFLVRLVRRPEIDPHLARFFSDKKKIDIAREAQSRGIPVTPLLEPGEVIENEHTGARGTFRTFEIAPGLEAQVASGFLELDGERMGPRERAPLLGEHNAQVYGEIGLRDAELAALRAQGVI